MVETASSRVHTEPVATTGRNIYTGYIHVGRFLSSRVLACFVQSLDKSWSANDVSLPPGNVPEKIIVLGQLI